MAETSGLLNRRTGDSRTEGSNPSVSATGLFAKVRDWPPKTLAKLPLEVRSREEGLALLSFFLAPHIPEVHKPPWLRIGERPAAARRDGKR